MSYIKLVSIKDIGRGEVKISAWESRWFGFSKRRRVWIGSCTVFNDIDTGETEDHWGGYGKVLSSWYFKHKHSTKI